MAFSIKLFCISIIIFVAQFSTPVYSSVPLITRAQNGLTIIIQEDHSAPLVAVEIWVKAGSSYEPAQKNGLSHFIEHLIFSGTNGRIPGILDLEIETLGGSLDAKTSRDGARYYTTVPSCYFNRAIELLVDSVFNLRISEDDIIREKKVILDELSKKRNDALKICRDELANLLYLSHPYAKPIEGTPESIASVGISDIINYHKTRYTPSNSAIVVVGDIDVSETLNKVGILTASLAKSIENENKSIIIESPKKQLVKEMATSFKNEHLAVGFIGPSISDFKECCVMDIISAHLGFGYRSWLITHLIKDKQYAIDGNCDFLSEKHSGMLYFFITTKHGYLNIVLDAIKSKLSTLTTVGISSFDLELAKRSVLGLNASQQETVSGKAGYLGYWFILGFPEYSEKYISTINNITNAEITSIAKKYLDYSSCAILFALPSKGKSDD